MLCGSSYLPASLRSLLRVIWRRGNQIPGAHLSPSLPGLQLAACKGEGEGQMQVKRPGITPHYSSRSTPQVLLLQPACFGDEKQIYLFETLSQKHLLSAPSQHAQTLVLHPLPLTPTMRPFLFHSPPQESRFSRKSCKSRHLYCPSSGLRGPSTPQARLTRAADSPLGQQPHARRAQDVQRRLLVLARRDVRGREPQQRPQVGGGLLGGSRGRGDAWRGRRREPARPVRARGLGLGPERGSTHRV